MLMVLLLNEVNQPDSYLPHVNASWFCKLSLQENPFCEGEPVFSNTLLHVQQAWVKTCFPTC